MDRTAVSSRDLRAKAQTYRQEAASRQNPALRQNMIELAMNIERLATMTEAYEAGVRKILAGT